ncbi:hypothetical protein LX36DRAFT_465179 [Colletotrichum falcatum]|nr:hypothetical protein LX36DRAFT_465179 [Colletotrichum falcatum]
MAMVRQPYAVVYMYILLLPPPPPPPLVMQNGHRYVRIPVYPVKLCHPASPNPLRIRQRNQFLQDTRVRLAAPLAAWWCRGQNGAPPPSIALVSAVPESFTTCGSHGQSESQSRSSPGQGRAGQSPPISPPSAKGIGIRPSSCLCSGLMITYLGR